MTKETMLAWSNGTGDIVLVESGSSIPMSAIFENALNARASAVVMTCWPEIFSSRFLPLQFPEEKIPGLFISFKAGEKLKRRFQLENL